MQQFIVKFQKEISGVLSGFDRVLFRGTLPRLSYSGGMKLYLIQNKILCRHYEDHVKAVSQRVRTTALGFQEPRHRRSGEISYGRQLSEGLWQSQHPDCRPVSCGVHHPKRGVLQGLPTRRGCARGSSALAKDAAWGGRYVPPCRSLTKNQLTLL